MKKTVNILTICVSLLLMSCSDWLDVTPPSQIREEDQFETVEGFQQALMGCYLGMTHDLLYGKALTWSTIELMAGQFEDLQSSSNNDYSISKFNYESNNAQKYVDGIWSQAYNVIANANNALKYADKNKDKIDNINYSIIKGELLAIRAQMHFDLMRLYGYGNLGNRTDVLGKSTIPYVTMVEKEMTSQLSYKETIDKIVKDLEEAIELLKIDPVTNLHPFEFYEEVNLDGFYDNRQQRFNYYATSLLLARVYMWEGSSDSNSKALQLANTVLQEVEEKDMVTWATSNSVTSDPVMNTEHLFSLNTQNLFEKTSQYFKLNIHSAGDIYAQYISSNRLKSIYEVEGVGATDFRFSRLYSQNNLMQDGENTYTPIKFYGTVGSNVSTNYIPLMRLPEAYYIAAESYLHQPSPDVAKALDLLNKVREKRGITEELTNLDSDEVMAEILKEYHKEFYCEGIMFFLYKRIGKETIPGYLEEAGDDVYLMPYPNTEIQMGRSQ